MTSLLIRIVPRAILASAIMVVVGCQTVSKPSIPEKEVLIPFDLMQDFFHVGITHVSIWEDTAYHPVPIRYLDTVDLKFPKRNDQNFDCDEIASWCFARITEDHSQPPLSVALFFMDFNWVGDVPGHRALVCLASDNYFWYLDPMYGQRMRLNQFLQDPDVKLETVRIYR